MAIEKIGVDKFLELSQDVKICDVRSQSEYASGHIPAAVNIPLFSDIERESVGIRYKKEGRIRAINQGLKLIGPQLADKLDAGLKLADGKTLLMHCWRGGMRSETMAWLFSLAGIDVRLLDGGYKEYRHYILHKLSERRKLLILGGLTGSSKTHILNHLGKKENQIIDLEKIANHKGSAFGALGQFPQPTTEHFANLLFDEWKSLDPDKPLWMEDESRNIGSVFMPDFFYNNMQEAPAIVLMMDIKTRMPRLLKEYSCFPEEALIASVERISKRLGGDNTKDAISAIRSGDMAKAIEITLIYYDKAYLYGLKRKKDSNIIYVETDTDDVETNSEKILEAAGRLTY